jgi:hypothetical protein
MICHIKESHGGLAHTRLEMMKNKKTFTTDEEDDPVVIIDEATGVEIKDGYGNLSSDPKDWKVSD